MSKEVKVPSDLYKKGVTGRDNRSGSTTRAEKQSQPPSLAKGSSASPYPTTLTPDFEPEPEWKASLMKSIEHTLRPTVERLEDERLEKLIGVIPCVITAARIRYEKAMGELRLTANDHYAWLLERERQVRRWRATGEVDEEWSEIFMKERQERLDKRRATTGGVDQAVSTTRDKGRSQSSSSAKLPDGAPLLQESDRDRMRKLSKIFTEALLPGDVTPVPLSLEDQGSPRTLTHTSGITEPRQDCGAGIGTTPPEDPSLGAEKDQGTAQALPYLKYDHLAITPSYTTPSSRTFGPRAMRPKPPFRADGNGGSPFQSLRRPYGPRNARSLKETVPTDSTSSSPRYRLSTVHPPHKHCSGDKGSVSETFEDSGEDREQRFNAGSTRQAGNSKWTEEVREKEAELKAEEAETERRELEVWPRDKELRQNDEDLIREEKEREVHRRGEGVCRMEEGVIKKKPEAKECADEAKTRGEGENVLNRREGEPQDSDGLLTGTPKVPGAWPSP